ncbi:MAG: hypothetical protein JSW53_04955 [Candidatus Bathyarchaeota archaeon]|nr:MAG: hypothetical protein JSW53_04955 [Candidatus Bathyarchaeota archaeon]
MRKLTSCLAMIALIASFALAIPIYATPIQTKQGCQTEAADYLVDVIWKEFGPEIYELTHEELLDFVEAMGMNEDAIEAFVPLILADGTVAGYFGPCCFKGGPKTYVDARNNGFPNGCCKSPDFSTFPLNYLGDGNGNPCLCQAGLHPTSEGRVYGGEIITIGDSQFVILDETLYLLIMQLNGEEWAVIPIPT